MFNDENLPELTEQQRRRRYVVLVLGIIVLAAVIYFGPMLREQEPDYYDPARTALVNARLRFEESLGHEQTLITQLQIVRKELDSAITQLGRAADLDPADRARIEDLRASLLSIEQTDGPEELGSDELYQSYRDLLAQMDALITDLDNRSR